MEGKQVADNTGEGRKKFCCKYCDKTFSSAQALGGHQNCHLKEREAIRRAQLEAELFAIQSKLQSSKNVSTPFSHPQNPYSSYSPMQISAPAPAPATASLRPPSNFFSSPIPHKYRYQPYTVPNYSFYHPIAQSHRLDPRPPIGPPSSSSGHGHMSGDEMNYRLMGLQGKNSPNNKSCLHQDIKYEGAGLVYPLVFRNKNNSFRNGGASSFKNIIPTNGNDGQSPSAMASTSSGHNGDSGKDGESDRDGDIDLTLRL